MLITIIYDMHGAYPEGNTMQRVALLTCVVQGLLILTSANNEYGFRLRPLRLHPQSANVTNKVLECLTHVQPSHLV